MRQVTQFRYKVQKGEVVTFRFTPVKTGPRVTFSQSPGGFRKIKKTPNLTFTFAVTQPRAKFHIAKCEFSFMPEDPDDARFDIKVKGSKGQSYDVRPVKKTSASKDRGFRFKVTK